MNNSVALEPLFPNDLENEDILPEESTQIIDTMDVTLKVSAINRIGKEIEMYQRQLDDAKFFYEDRIKRCEQRQYQLKQMILGFLGMNKLKNIRTPLGTAFMKELTTRLWPPDDALVAWATEHLPSAIRVKKEPDKRLLSDHIKSSGEIPDGYSESKETRLYIK